LFQLTIGYTVKKIKEEIYNLKSKENIEFIKNKIREEINAAIKKDKLLDDRDKKLINDFIKKIKKELQNH
jgi:transcriptional regulator NrdR family protein